MRAPRTSPGLLALLAVLWSGGASPARAVSLALCDIGVVFPEESRAALDANGDGLWGFPTDLEKTVALFAGPGQIRVGDWNGDGAADVGVASSDGVFRIDLDGDRVFGPGDRELPFTPSGQGPAQPIAGVWSQP
jgi:hypothetical protein